MNLNQMQMRTATLLWLCVILVPTLVDTPRADAQTSEMRSHIAASADMANGAPFSSAFDTTAVRTVTTSVLNWQLRHPGRYAVWGSTTPGDSVSLVLHGDGTIVRREIEGWERPQWSSASERPVAPEWTAFFDEKTRSDFSYRDLPTAVRRSVERELGGGSPTELNVSTAFHPRGWVMGALYAGMAEWGTTTDSDRVLTALRDVGRHTNWELGNRVYVADDHAVGQMYLALFEHSGHTVQKQNVQMQFDWILRHPPEQSLTWKDGIRRWTWADALFMSPPVWAHLAALTGESRYREYMNDEWWATTDRLYDQTAHLFYRDDRFIGQRGSHDEKLFWSRGNGWVLAGLVRVLEHLPTDHPDRSRYVRLYREMAHRLIELQAEDGLWRSNLLDPAGTADPEVSGSGFFCYGLAWGLNEGLLDTERGLPAVKKAWDGLVNAVHSSGRLTRVQPPGDRPASVNEDETAPYGVGAFLLAASEIYKLAK